MKYFRCLLFPLLLASAAQAYVVKTDDSGIYVLTWNPGTLPMQIKLPTNPVLIDGTNYASSVQAAMQTWNTVLGTLQFTSTVTNTPSPAPAGTYSNSANDPNNEIVMDSKYAGSDFDSQTLAITLNWTSGNTFTQADIVFNTAWTWDSYRGNLRSVEDIRRVVIHELGHVLGLDHPDQFGQSVNAVMNSTVSNVDTIQADDIAGIQLLYGAPGFVPANNDFANATTITLSSSSIQLTGTNIAATKQTGEPVIAGATAPGHSVWWKWTAPSSASATVTTLGSNFDTVLGVYTGSVVSSLTLVASNDDAELPVQGVDNPQRKRTSTVTFNATSGTTYSIAVDGWGSAAQQDVSTLTGAITLHLDFAGSLGGNVAPAFTLQPANQTVTAGNSVTFTAAASGTPAPTFQWRKNGSPIGGATSSSYTIASVVPADAGSYTVVATNSVNSATSNAATLTVNVTPVITLQPLGQTLTVGNSVTFTAAASGTPAPTFQWQKNGAAIGGATSGSYTIASVTLADAGTYTFVATNSAGSTTSNPAALAVYSPPRGDFNSDGQSDILWENVSSGDHGMWLMSATVPAVWINLPAIALEWKIAGTGDFNGDKQTDILWQNSVTGERKVWLMNGVNVSGEVSLGVIGLDWNIAGTGDYSGDGRPDILWENVGSGDRGVWVMNGTVPAAWVNLPTIALNWRIVGGGDFNGDGMTDILWENVGSGDRGMWIMDGMVPVAWINLPSIALDWRIVGTGDFNQDGMTDILWENVGSGDRGMWIMSATVPAAWINLPSIALAWRIAQ